MLIPSPWFELLLLGLGISLLGCYLYWLQRFTIRTLGYRVILFTGWIGTPLHELSHVAASLLFGHQIIKVRLFEPDPDSGTLGYVHYAYRPDSLYQQMGRFFSGIAPAVGGIISVAALLVWGWPHSDLFLQSILPLDTAISPIPASLDGAGKLWLYVSGMSGRDLLQWLVCLYAQWSIILHAAPSGADLRGGAGGAGVLILLVCAASTIEPVLAAEIFSIMLQGVGVLAAILLMFTIPWCCLLIMLRRIAVALGIS